MGGRLAIPREDGWGNDVVDAAAAEDVDDWESDDAWPGWLQESGLISLETVIRPVTMLQQTSHREVRSSNRGLVTPAMKPGLRENGVFMSVIINFIAKASEPSQPDLSSHLIEDIDLCQVSIGKGSTREAPQQCAVARDERACCEDVSSDDFGRLLVTEKNDASLSEKSVD